MNPNASSDVENATGDGNATGKKQVKNNLDNPQLINTTTNNNDCFLNLCNFSLAVFNLYNGRVNYVSLILCLQASKSSLIKPSDDSKQLSEGVKCPDDDNLSSESLEEGELPRTDHESIKEFEESEIGYGESLKCTSSRVEACSGDLGVGGEESTPHKKVYTSEPSFLISHS